MRLVQPLYKNGGSNLVVGDRIHTKKRNRQRATTTAAYIKVACYLRRKRALSKKKDLLKR